MSELITVAGIIALGINGGLLQAYYTNNSSTGKVTDNLVNIWIPTTINVVISFFLLWGILSSSKDPGMKTIYCFLMLIFSGGELYFTFVDKNNPDNNFNPALAQVVLFASSIFKLFVLVTLHCDVSSGTSENIFSKLKFPKFKNERPKKEERREREREREPEREPRREREREREIEAEPDQRKSQRLFEFVLKKTDLDDAEKEIQLEKFSTALKEDDPWQKTSNIFNNVLQKVREEEFDTPEERSELRMKFRLAMGRPLKGGR
jgi:hypothetical protein